MEEEKAVDRELIENQKLNKSNLSYSSAFRMAGTDPDAAFKLDSSCAWMYDGYGADFVYGYVLMNLG